MTATLDQPAPPGGVEVTLALMSGDPGTAALGRDYTLPGTFTIAAGGTTAEADVVIKDDAVNERDETINLTALNNVAGSVTDLTITIQDNEESRSPPEGPRAYPGLQPENVKVAPKHEGLTVTFDDGALSSITYLVAVARRRQPGMDDGHAGHVALHHRKSHQRHPVPRPGHRRARTKQWRLGLRQRDAGSRRAIGMANSAKGADPLRRTGPLHHHRKGTHHSSHSRRQGKTCWDTTF